MAGEFNFIKDLTTEKDDWVIQVRVTRKWESINLKTINLISHDVILLDKNVSFNFLYTRRHLLMFTY